MLLTSRRHRDFISVSGSPISPLRPLGLNLSSTTTVMSGPSGPILDSQGWLSQPVAGSRGRGRGRGRSVSSSRSAAGSLASDAPRSHTLLDEGIGASASQTRSIGPGSDPYEVRNGLMETANTSEGAAASAPLTESPLWLLESQAFQPEDLSIMYSEQGGPSHSQQYTQGFIEDHDGVAGTGLDDADAVGSPSLLQADPQEHDQHDVAASYTRPTVEQGQVEPDGRESMLPMSFTGGECSLESTQEDVPAADQLGLQHSQTLDCTQDKSKPTDNIHLAIPRAAYESLSLDEPPFQPGTVLVSQQQQTQPTSHLSSLAPTQTPIQDSVQHASTYTATSNDIQSAPAPMKAHLAPSSHGSAEPPAVDNTAKKSAPERKCGICRLIGHARNKCPYRPQQTESQGVHSHLAFTQSQMPFSAPVTSTKPPPPTFTHSQPTLTRPSTFTTPSTFTHRQPTAPSTFTIPSTSDKSSAAQQTDHTVSAAAAKQPAHGGEISTGSHGHQLWKQPSPAPTLALPAFSIASTQGPTREAQRSGSHRALDGVELAAEAPHKLPPFVSNEALCEFLDNVVKVPHDESEYIFVDPEVLDALWNGTESDIDAILRAKQPSGAVAGASDPPAVRAAVRRTVTFQLPDEDSASSSEPTLKDRNRGEKRPPAVRGLDEEGTRTQRGKRGRGGKKSSPAALDISSDKKTGRKTSIKRKYGGKHGRGPQAEKGDAGAGRKMKSTRNHHKAEKEAERDSDGDDSEDIDFDPDLCPACQEPGEVVMCEYCLLSYHTQCAVPPLSAVPEGIWVCNSCKTADLVWAKVGQFPRWPAKVLKDIDEKRKLVWFFGTDDRWVVPATDVEPFADNHVRHNTGKQQRGLKEAVEKALAVLQVRGGRATVDD